MRILLLNGPNLGRLGKRQPELYGTTTLAEVEAAAADHARALGHELDAFQSNHEGALIDRIEQGDYDAIVINPGALTHYAWSLHDALLGAECPVVEVHISDILSREPWRHFSVVEPVASHRIMGTHAQQVGRTRERASGHRVINPAAPLAGGRAAEGPDTGLPRRRRSPGARRR